MFISPTEVDDDLDVGALDEAHDLVDLDDDLKLDDCLIELELNHQNTCLVSSTILYSENGHRAQNCHRPHPGHQDHEGFQRVNRHRPPRALMNQPLDG